MSAQRKLFEESKTPPARETKEEYTGAVYCDYDETISSDIISNNIFDSILNGWYAMNDDPRYEENQPVLIVSAVAEGRMRFSDTGFPMIQDMGKWRPVASPNELASYFTEAEKQEMWEVAKLTPIRGSGKAWREAFETIDMNKQHIAIISRSWFPFLIKRYLTDPVANGDKIGLSKELVDKIFICCTPLTEEQTQKNGKNELIKLCDEHFKRNAKNFNLIMVEDHLPYLISAAGLLFDPEFKSLAAKKALASEKQDKGLPAGGIYADYDKDKTGAFIALLAKVSTLMKGVMMKRLGMTEEATPTASEFKKGRG